MLDPSRIDIGSKDFVSVIVPVYNVEPYLEKCIKSLLNQDYGNYEIIFVDDGSSDCCGLICDEYKKQNNNIKVVHKENGGLSDARNAGIEVAVGKYLTFVDSDDYVAPTYLSYLVNLITRESGCKVAHSNHYIERGNRKTTNAPVLNKITTFTRKEAVDAVLYHDRVDVCVCGAIFDASVFYNVRFPKGRLFEDTYIFSDIIAQTDTYVYGDMPQYYYVQRKGSIVNQSFKPENLEFIDSVKRLTDYVMHEYPDLEQGCHRRITHSYLSVLRYMEHIEAEYKSLRDELTEMALMYIGDILKDTRTPKRDKMALRLLKIGYLPFYKGWSLYSVMRK